MDLESGCQAPIFLLSCLVTRRTRLASVSQKQNEGKGSLMSLPDLTSNSAPDWEAVGGQASSIQTFAFNIRL